MAEISLYLTNVSVSLGQTTVEQVGKEPFFMFAMFPFTTERVLLSLVVMVLQWKSV